MVGLMAARPPHEPSATAGQIAELARAIADQAQAIADGRVIGPLPAAAARLTGNVETLAAWINRSPAACLVLSTSAGREEK